MLLRSTRVWSQDVVSCFEGDRLDVQPTAVQQRGQLTVELTHVHNDLWGLFKLLLASWLFDRKRKYKMIGQLCRKRRRSKNLAEVDLYKMTEMDLPALWVLVEALAGSKFFTRSKLSSSRPSLSSGMTIVAFSLQINTHNTSEKPTPQHSTLWQILSRCFVTQEMVLTWPSVQKLSFPQRASSGTSVLPSSLHRWGRWGSTLSVWVGWLWDLQLVDETEFSIGQHHETGLHLIQRPRQAVGVSEAFQWVIDSQRLLVIASAVLPHLRPPPSVYPHLLCCPLPLLHLSPLSPSSGSRSGMASFYFLWILRSFSVRAPFPWIFF